MKIDLIIIPMAEDEVPVEQPDEQIVPASDEDLMSDPAVEETLEKEE